MHEPTDPPAARQTADTMPQLCCHCGDLTREPVLVGSVHTPSGAGSDLYACPKDAVLFGEHTIRRAS